MFDVADATDTAKVWGAADAVDTLGDFDAADVVDRGPGGCSGPMDMADVVKRSQSVLWSHSIKECQMFLMKTGVIWCDMIHLAKYHIMSDSNSICATGWLPVMLSDLILVSHMTSKEVT